MSRGNFISFEGIDSVGKSGHRDGVIAELTARGRELVVVTDPSRHAPWGEWQDEFQKGTRLAKPADAMMLLAARIDTSLRLINPALSDGTDVLADRYADSWLAYQSIRLAEHFGSSDSALEYLLELQGQSIRAGLVQIPDRTFLITDDPDEAMRRSTNLGKDSKYENLEMQRRVSAQYDLLAERFPDRIQTVSNRGRSFNEVHEELREHLAVYLGGTASGEVMP